MVTWFTGCDDLIQTLLQESTDDPETKAGGKPGQQLDDDEDRKNPAYIPRKGLFFEHDVRGHAQEEERYCHSAACRGSRSVC